MQTQSTKDTPKGDPIGIPVKEAARQSGYSERTIWNLIAKKKLKVIKPPGIRRTTVDYLSFKQLLST